MLLGEFHHNIDDKGRLVVPTKFREELGSEFIITRGIEICLFFRRMGKVG
jgi:MraZ protein